MTEKTGRFAVLEQLLADGVEYIFGNPGTVEQGFLDALWDYPDLKYILTLQETIAVMAADGYARATKKPTIVQIHSTPGLGNSIGALYQAKRGHSPLVVIGGDSGAKYQGMDLRCRPHFPVAGVAPGDQDCRYAAHGAGVHLPTPGYPRFSSGGVGAAHVNSFGSDGTR